jgi:protein disulfide-isomerase A1
MTILLVIFIISFTFISCEEQFPLENDVIVLTEANFDKAINKYEYLMVFFYAPWCIRCKNFHPEYEKAAKILRKENLFLAKVDATVEKNLDKRYEFTGYPAIKLFIKGKDIDYNKARNEVEVVNWMRRKTNGPATKTLNSSEEVEKFKNENDVALIYFGNNKRDIEEYTKAARKLDDFNFGIVEKEDIINKYSKKGNIVLYKNFDERKRELTDIKMENIEELINKYSSPKLMKFNEKAAYFIFDKKLPALILFAEEKSSKWVDYEKLMLNISEKLNYKLKVVLTDIKGVKAAKLAEKLNVNINDFPSIRILDTSGKYIKKYKMEKNNINEKDILKFVNDWENKKLKSYVKSSEEPKDNDGDVFVVVGSTYEKEVLNNDKDVVILFYSPLCYRCKALLPKYEIVAEKLKSKNPKLLLAKIDGIENEVETIDDHTFPKIRLYPGNKKNKPPIEYNGDDSVNNIIKFIKDNVAYPIVINGKGNKNEEL